MKFYLASALTFLIAINNIVAQSWQRIQLMPPLANNTPAMLDGMCYNDTCLVVERGGCFIHTNDFFETITVDSTYKGYLLHAMSFVDYDIGYVTSTYANGGMLSTIDRGITWNELPFSNSQNSPGDVIHFVKLDTGYVAKTSMYSGLRTTFNGGLYWSNPAILNFECPSIFSIQFTNDSTGYILSNDNPHPPFGGFGEFHIFKTTDYGINWEDINRLSYLYYPMGIGDLHFIDDTTAILALPNVILKTFDGGYSFDTVMQSYDGFGQHIPAISFANHDTGFVAYASSVFKTYNAGNSWIKTDFSFDDNDSFNEIWFIKAASTTKVVVGCQKGCIYKTETGGGVWSDVKDMEKDNGFAIYPNPTNHHLTIQTQTTTPTTLQITTTDGRVVMEQGAAMQNKWQVDVSSLAKGLYFAVMETEQGRAVRRFVRE